MLDSLDIDGNLRPAVGVSSSWAYRALVLPSPDGAYRLSLMTNQSFTQGMGKLRKQAKRSPAQRHSVPRGQSPDMDPHVSSGV